MPGPPPKPDAQRRRRNLVPGTVLLPAEGRKGRPPAWPLEGKQRAGELAAWREVWRTPQAVAWSRLGWVRTVARYVRLMVDAEKPDAPAAICSEVRQLEHALGLTPMSMLRLKWEIVTDELGAARAERSTPNSSTGTPAARERLRAVDAATVGRQ